jgi:hypothetical protein
LLVEVLTVTVVVSPGPLVWLQAAATAQMAVANHVAVQLVIGSPGLR